MSSTSSGANTTNKTESSVLIITVNSSTQKQEAYTLRNHPIIRDSCITTTKAKALEEETFSRTFCHILASAADLLFHPRLQSLNSQEEIS